MSETEKSTSSSKDGAKQLRLWPGMIGAALLIMVWLMGPMLFPEYPEVGLLGALGFGLIVMIWWLFFSRAPWLDRLMAIGVMVLAVILVSQFVDISIAGSMMGLMVPMYSIPLFAVALVVWAVVTRNSASGVRRISLVAMVAIIASGWLLIRTGGFTGAIEHDLAWRWSESPEELLLKEQEQKMGITADSLMAMAEPDWPGFRGQDRSGVVTAVEIETDWKSAPPTELWRRAIGPGWSSFAVSAGLIYTQEQRGEEEAVSCYSLDSGQLVWRHSDPARFWESNGGAGPRGTPTLKNGRVYTFGGTGIVNVLDATDGNVIWSRNAGEDTDTPVPGWGFSSSPLVWEDIVIVAAAGALIGYDAETGEQRWVGPDGDYGYSSPHLMVIDSVPQIVLARGAGVTSVSPENGHSLWEHEFPSGTRIVQPALTSENVVLASLGDKNGMRSISPTHTENGWVTEERWSTRGLKPYFNDFVVQGDHAYGFDGNILACINLSDGARVWKGGRYGHGQMVLLAEQGVLLVLTEKGDLALVKATSEKFVELARHEAIKGKTWNHPVLVDDIVLVRNGEEMAAFRLAAAKG